MTRKYTTKDMLIPPEVMTECKEPDSILYSFGDELVTLTGDLASLYRGMIWMYGERQAALRFWCLWHQKSVPTPENAFSAL